MKIKAIQDFQGSLNGFEVIDIAEGTVLDVDYKTAKIFMDAGFCEPVVEGKTPGSIASQKIKPNAN